MDKEKIISQMTLEEKAEMLTGKDFWSTKDFPNFGIRSLFLSDGPHGLRKQAAASDHLGLNASIPATCFPTASVMACSWDEELGERIGEALGEEAAALNVDVLLGPGLNIKRNPLCGRNFEYFSEDPYLAGKMAAAYVRGIQSKGVAACVKHFAANNREYRRMTSDSVIDERTLREIYLRGFEIAVKEGGAKCVMSAYNKVNGEFANENPHLLKEILREDWGFDGVVVTDWGGCNDRVDGLKCGNELEMPACKYAVEDVITAVEEGRIEESLLEESIRRLLELSEFTARKQVKAYDERAHHALAREAAEKSAVLLENDGILPLKAGTRVALVGDFAFLPRYQGAGSSVVNPTFLSTAEKVFASLHPSLSSSVSKHVSDSSAEILSSPDSVSSSDSVSPSVSMSSSDSVSPSVSMSSSDSALSSVSMSSSDSVSSPDSVSSSDSVSSPDSVSSSDSVSFFDLVSSSLSARPSLSAPPLSHAPSVPLSVVGCERGFHRFGKKSKKLFRRALQVAKKAEVTLFFAGLDEFSEAEGIDRADMKIPQNQIELFRALVAAGNKVVVLLHCGSSVELDWTEGAAAVFWLGLSGQAGAEAAFRLVTGEVNPSGKLAETWWGKYEDCSTSSPDLFPGGEDRVEYKEGLFVGYRSGRKAKYPFGYGLSYTKFEYSNLRISDGKIFFVVKNVGSLSGKEIAGIYYGKKDGKVKRPKRQLFAFINVYLKEGEEKEVSVPYDIRDFSYYDVGAEKWLTEAGIYDIEVGASSEDIRLCGQLFMEGVTPTEKACINVSFPLWKEAKKRKGMSIHENSTVGDLRYAKGWVGRAFSGGIRFAVVFCRAFRMRSKANTLVMGVLHQPVRGLAKFGGMNRNKMEGLLLMFNGYFFKGIKQFFKKEKGRVEDK